MWDQIDNRHSYSFTRPVVSMQTQCCNRGADKLHIGIVLHGQRAPWRFRARRSGGHRRSNFICSFPACWNPEFSVRTFSLGSRAACRPRGEEKEVNWK